MLRFVERNLVLDGMGKAETKRSVIFTGNGIEGEKGTAFSLEVVIDAKRSLSEAEVQKHLSNKKKGKVAKVLLFPRSILYSGAARTFTSPYLKPAHLALGLDNLFEHFRGDMGGFSEFYHRNVAALNNAERYLADNHSHQIAYYNPLHDTLQVMRFIRFPEGRKIPSHPLYMEGLLYQVLGTQPVTDREAIRKFEKNQEAYHETVRKMDGVCTIKNGEKFTLENKGAAARIVPYSVPGLDLQPPTPMSLHAILPAR
ncbi:MAG: hypothetical protein A2Z88_00790 [Omnitrophica WOR_2 bacterium GWA2_47_8]|nr:MAG: hypothetical protein A2Z88_00790 [Omnitrophica WOR_2 bacterium GWA2_47_8]